MPTVKQRIPAFCDGFTAEKSEFNTIDDLLAVSFIKSFTSFADFSGFAIDKKMEPTLLIATYKKGKEYWVIAYIDDSSTLKLPEWKEGEPGYGAKS